MAALAVLLYTVLHPEARRSRKARPKATAVSAKAEAQARASGGAGEPAALSGAARAAATPPE